MERATKGIGLITTGVMFLVLQMGALVTNTGSQDGCGSSWPLCKGTFMPDWDYAAIVEFSHRAVSALAGMLIILLTVMVWRRRDSTRRLAVGALLLTCLQGGLGAAAVISPQPDSVLALHFGISLLCFSAVLLATLQLFRPQVTHSSAAPPHLRFWIWWVALFNYAVVYLGAYVRHVGASLACTGWPLCSGQWLPPLYGPVGANFAHRVGAALSVLLVARLVWMARQSTPAGSPIRAGATWAALLLLAQVASGAVMALGALNLLTQMIHSAIITAYWGVLSALCFQALPVTVSSSTRTA